MTGLKAILLLPYFMIVRFFLFYAPIGFWKLYYIGRRKVISGRTMDARAQAYLSFTKIISPSGPPSMHALRGGYDKMDGLLGGGKVSIGHVTDIEIPLDGRSLKARLYDDVQSDTPRPALLFFHGGGFVIGSLNSHDGFCRRLARDSKRRVIAIDYRMGPENRFPAAHDDRIDVWHWLIKNGESLNIDVNDIAITGDSAGAALTLVTTKNAMEDNTSPVKPSAIIPIYPPNYPEEENESRKTLAEENIVLTKAVLDWFRAHYRSDAMTLDDARITPSTVKFPPTYIITCGFDPLRDDGRAVADHLINLGTKVQYEEKSGLFHNYIIAAGVFPEVDQTTKDMAAFLNEYVK